MANIKKEEKMAQEIEQETKRFKKFLQTSPVMQILHKNLSFLLDDGKRIQSIEINDQMESYTDGKQVVVSGSTCFMHPEFDEKAWLAMMRVRLAHEVQHDNSSDFELLRNLRKWYADYMKQNYQIIEEVSEPIAQMVMNCVEDGRVNEIVVQRFPGYLPMMRFVNFGIRQEGGELKEPAKNSNQEIIDFQNQILSYSKTGLNLPGIHVYHGLRLETEFLKIRKYIDTGVASPTAKGCYDACVHILTESADYVADLVKESSDIMDAIKKLLQENYSQSKHTRTEQSGNSKSQGGKTIRIQIPSATSSSAYQDDDSNSEKASDSKNSETQKESGKNAEANNKEGKDSGKADSEKGKESESSPSSENSNAQNNEKDPSNSASVKNKHEFSNEADNNGQGSDSSQNSDEEDSNKSTESKNGKNGKSKKSEQKNQESKKSDRNSTMEDVIGSFGEEQPNPISEQELNEMLAAMRDELHRAVAVEASQKVEAAKNTQLSREDKKELAGHYKNLPDLNETSISITKAPLDSMIAAPAKNLHEKLETILMKRKAAASGYQRGRLDPRKLWKLSIQSTDVFQRKTPPKLSDCAVYELIDGSGSMSESAVKINNKRASKLTCALTTAAIMEESLKNLAATKITVFRAGYHDVEHILIKDFDQKPIGNRCNDALVTRQVSPNNGNMDGYSIRVAAMDLAKRPEKNKILIVLSDGLPSAYMSEKEAIADVHSAVKWARSHGIIVIAIMFGEDSYLKNSYPDYKKMYEQDIIAVRPADINMEFERLLKRVVK